MVRRRAVGTLLCIGIETPAVDMGFRKTPRSRVTNLAPLSIEIETSAGEMAVSKTPCSIVTDLALVGVGAEKKLVLPSKENGLLSCHLLFILCALTRLFILLVLLFVQVLAVPWAGVVVLPSTLLALGPAVGTHVPNWVLVWLDVRDGSGYRHSVKMGR